jgi:nuclear transport factor 2 (NTF2) superfamily protein
MNKSFFKLVLMGTIIIMLMGCQSQKSDAEKMIDFAKKYTAAWNSNKPEKVASFYAKDGSLTINDGTPAAGREEIAKIAESFMVSFPDMKLTLDSLVADPDAYRYYWTFEGTNSGPDGTGNKVVFSGFEKWTMNEEGLVQTSIGTYDARDYYRQLHRVMH